MYFSQTCLQTTVITGENDEITLKNLNETQIGTVCNTCISMEKQMLHSNKRFRKKNMVKSVVSVVCKCVWVVHTCVCCTVCICAVS